MVMSPSVETKLHCMDCKHTFSPSLFRMFSKEVCPKCGSENVKGIVGSSVFDGIVY